MNERQLNILVEEARNGSEEAYWKIVQEFYELIVRLSESNRNRIRSQEAFENQCFNRVREAIVTYDSKRGTFRAHVEAKLYERLRRFVKRNCERMKDTVVVSMVTKEGIEIEVIDELALVDGNLYANEKITGLAAGDLRKLAILNAWAYYGLNDSRTADLLAQIYGGHAESQRKYVTRFKSHCQTALANAI